MPQAGVHIMVLPAVSVGNPDPTVVAVTIPVPDPTVKLAIYLAPLGRVVEMLEREVPVNVVNPPVSLQKTPISVRAGLVKLVTSVSLDLTV